MRNLVAPLRNMLLRRIRRDIVTPTVPAGDAWECGVSALSSLMGYYGCHVPMEELRQATGVSRQGCNMLQMIKAARSYGLRARVFRKSPETLHEVSFPCIVHMNFNHFAVVEGMDNGRVFLNDQGCGPHDMPIEEFDEAFTGLVMALEPGPELRKTPLPPARLKLLFRILSPARKALAGAAMLSLVYGTAIALIAIELSARLEGRAGLIPVNVMMVGAALLALCALVLRGLCLESAGRGLSKTHLTRTLQHIMGLPASYFTLRFSDSIAARISAGSDIGMLLAGPLGGALLDLAAAGIAVVAIWFAFPEFRLAAFCMCALYIAVLWGIYGRRQNAWRRVRYAGEEAAGFSAWRLANIEGLKTAGRDAEAFSGMAGRQSKSLNANQEWQSELVYASVATRAGVAMSLAITFAYFAPSTVESTLGTGGLVGGALLSAAFCFWMDGALRHGKDFYTLQDIAVKLEEVYTYEKTDLRDVTTSDTPVGTVIMENVSFGYSSTRPALLNNVSIQIQPGQLVGIPGQSGVGKSTLVRLMCGLLAPWEGRVSTAGICSIVPAYPVFFEGSIRDNVSLRDSGVSDKDVIAALEDACLRETVSSLSGGIHAGLRPDAVNLSGGQRRRLALARALLRRPDILVLDETLDSLDAATEEKIRANLRRRGCTVVLVTSRVSTLAACAPVYRVQGGSVIQDAPALDLSQPEGDCLDSPQQTDSAFEGPRISIEHEPFRMVECPQDILVALRAVASVLPGAAVKVPEQLLVDPHKDAVRVAARASGLLLRRVRLRSADWWRRNHGPLVALREGRTVALLPTPGPGYRLIDQALDGPVQVDREIADGIAAEAFMPYRQTSGQTTSFMRLFWDALCAAKGNAVMAIGAGAACWLLWFGIALLPALPHTRGIIAFLPGLGLTVAVAGLTLAAGMALLRVQGKSLLFLQADVWGRLLRLPTRFYRTAAPSQLAGWAQQTGELMRLAASVPITLASGALVSITVLMLLRLLVPSLSAWVFALPAVGLLLPPLLALKENRFEREAFAQAAGNEALLTRLLKDLPGIRLLGAHRNIGNYWKKRFETELGLRWKSLRLRRYADIVLALSPVAALVVLSGLEHGGGALRVACFCLIFILYAGLAQRVSGSMAEAVRIIPQTARMRPLLETPLERRSGDKDIGPLDGSISATGLSFTYPGSGSPALKGVSLLARPGEMIAVTGPSGSGKSTLIRLLLGFEEPDSGDIRYGEHSMAEIDREAARRWMDAVLQDETLPPATIRSHIAGHSPYTLDQVWEAAKMACLDRDLASTPKELQGLADSDKLSTGQTQRIQIARALLHRPRILFLDETTSGLEPELQHEIMAKIRAMGITCIIVTHRPDALAAADRVYVIENGRIVTE